MTSGYKDTQIGPLPKEWKVLPLGSLLKGIQMGANYPSAARAAGPALLKPEDMAKGVFQVSQCDRIPSCVIPDARHRVAPGDLLFSTRNTLARVGRSALWRGELPEAYFNPNLLRLRIDGRRLVSGVFAIRALNMDSSLARLRSMATQSADIAAIATRDLARLPIPVPPPAEQEAIAGVLNVSFELLRSMELRLAKHQTIRRAIQEMFLSGEMRPSNASGPWQTRSLRDLETAGILRITRGRVISLKDIKADPGNHPVYSSSVATDGVLGRCGSHMFDEELITWSVDGGGEFFHRPRHKFSVTNACGIIRVDPERVNCRYLAESLDYLYRAKSFDYHTKPSPDTVRDDFEPGLPALHEQEAVVAVLTSLDTQIGALITELAKVRQVVDALTRDLLAGAVRVPVHDANTTDVGHVPIYTRIAAPNAESHHDVSS